MANRLTRPERKLQTRERLLDTARELFLARGYAATTLDHIADAAGLTKGAVYSNFSSKDDLFLALYAARVDDRVRDVQAAAERGTFEQITRTNARRIVARQRREPEWYGLLLEFTTYAVRHPELRRRVAREHRRLVEAIARTMDEAAAREGRKLRYPAKTLAHAASALGSGVRLEHDIDPEDTPADLMEIAFDLLLRTAISPAREKEEKTDEHHDSRTRRPLRGDQKAPAEPVLRAARTAPRAPGLAGRPPTRRA
jgi:AcrR family transcriptional regulator